MSGFVCLVLFAVWFCLLGLVCLVLFAVWFCLLGLVCLVWSVLLFLFCFVSFRFGCLFACSVVLFLVVGWVGFAFLAFFVWFCLFCFVLFCLVRFCFVLVMFVLFAYCLLFLFVSLVPCLLVLLLSFGYVCFVALLVSYCWFLPPFLPPLIRFRSELADGNFLRSGLSTWKPSGDGNKQLMECCLSSKR